MKTITLLSLLISSAFAFDSFFENTKRDELFEITDFNIPTIKVNMSEEELKNLHLSYQCRRDTSCIYYTRNVDCYTAPWINLNEILNKIVEQNIIEKSQLSESDLAYLENTDITIEEFENLLTTYTSYSMEDIFRSSRGYFEIPEYTVKNATLNFEIDDKVEKVEEVKLSIGGAYTKGFSKLGYNINIKNGTLFGVSNLRLRTEVVDPAFLRDKLAYDACNLLELPSLSANYAKLYFNDEYMGFYLLRDAVKKRWIENKYGEVSTEHLYTCHERDYGENEFFNCINDDEEIIDDGSFTELQNRLAEVKSREELDEFFDTTLYMKWQALRYLLNSWDHYANYHNTFFYKSQDATTGKEKWITILYDFDSDIGAYRIPFPNLKFDEEIYENHPMFNLLDIRESNPELIGYIEEFMRKYFNPETIFSRIDTIRDFIAPYVKDDRTPDADGHLYGRLPNSSNRIEDKFTYDDFYKNSEYTTIKLRKYDREDHYVSYSILGIKYYFVERFKFICETYDIDCSYADEFIQNLDYKEDLIIYEERQDGCLGGEYPCCTGDLTIDSIMYEDSGILYSVNDDWCIIDTSVGQCWSESIGIPCCQNINTEPTDTTTIKHKAFGEENGQRCGIDLLQFCPKGDEYKCCNTCEVAFEDDYKWNIEDGDWCSIPYSCNAESKENTASTTATATVTNIVTDTIISPDETCWSLEDEGYPCCTNETTEIVYISKTKGTKYGVENDDWCGITDLQLNYIIAQTETVPDLECASTFQKCGGPQNPDTPSCCEEGNFCWENGNGISECLPNSFKGLVE